jgi:hypothetical protein
MLVEVTESPLVSIRVVSSHAWWHVFPIGARYVLGIPSGLSNGVSARVQALLAFCAGRKTLYMGQVDGGKEGVSTNQRVLFDFL